MHSPVFNHHPPCHQIAPDRILFHHSVLGFSMDFPRFIVSQYHSSPNPNQTPVNHKQLNQTPRPTLTDAKRHFHGQINASKHSDRSNGLLDIKQVMESCRCLRKVSGFSLSHHHQTFLPMGSLAISGSRATEILSQRGQSAMALGSKNVMWNIISNLWHSETNPDGYVSVGVAENALLHDTLLEYIHSNICLTANYLTYNDGSTGSNRLRKAVAHFLNRHMNPIRPVAPQHIVMTNGCSSAIEHLSWAFMESGEGILLGKPYYGTFIADLSLRPGAVVVPVDFDGVDPLGLEMVMQYEKAAIEFEARTGKRVRAVMLCHPHNPLGRCYSRSVITDLMRMCQARQLHLISDEIYALSVWNNHIDTDAPLVPFESVLSIDTTGILDPDLVHVLWGMSKDFGANGLRVGAIISQSNPDLHKALEAMSLYSYVSGPSDHITSSLLVDDEFTDQYIQLNREKLSDAYALFVQLLGKHDIEYMHGCNAGFFVWLNLGKKYLEANPGKGVGSNAALTDMIMQKLLDSKVFLASGTAFGSEKPGWFRVVFAHSFPYLEEAMRRILLAVGPER